MKLLYQNCIRNGYDTLQGGSGDDTYVFNIGDGQDTIAESGGTDTVMFGEGIESKDVKFWHKNNNLKVTVRDGSITILDYFRNDNSKVEAFQTSDGTELDVRIEPELESIQVVQPQNRCSSLVNTRLNVMIQARASFEDSTGMMWEDAAVQKNEQADDKVNQWWVKEVV